MKSLTLRRILSSVLALSLMLALAGCNYDKPIVTDTEEFYLTKNDEMDEETKASLDEITSTFEAYLKDANPENIKNYLDDDFETTDEQLTQFAGSFVSNNASFTLYDSYYIEGIGHLYEFDCGFESGWMYKVNGTFPNYGCSAYELQGGEDIVWCYTCVGLGTDVGGTNWQRE